MRRSAHRRSAGPARTRRSGPPDEERWWDEADQVIVEKTLLTLRDLPKRWRPMPMVNNAEMLDPFADVPAADAVRRARSTRRLTALDEGVAFQGKDSRLVVLRVEMFADPDEEGHRETWRRDGPAVLTATYKARWAERAHVANWIDVRARRSADLPAPLDPRIDWLRVEDHTDPSRRGVVRVYEHLSLWAGRAHAVVTVRHLLDQQLDEVAAAVGATVLDRLEVSLLRPA